MDLTNRVVLITGGKRVGPAMAEALATRGADIVLAYNRSSREADAGVDLVKSLGRRGAAVQADVSRAESCAALIAEVDRQFGRLDVLIAMASVYERVPIETLTPEIYARQVGVDLGGTVNSALAAIPLMKRSGGGRIITFSDWLAASGRPRYRGFLPYYVAKAGVKAFTEALALELAGDNIVVNAIAPGPIHPPPDTSDEEREAVTRETPLGRWGGSEALVQSALALLETNFVTGETVRTDGGRHLR